MCAVSLVQVEGEVQVSHPAAIDTQGRGQDHFVTAKQEWDFWFPKRLPLTLCVWTILSLSIVVGCPFFGLCQEGESFVGEFFSLCLLAFFALPASAATRLMYMRPKENPRKSPVFCSLNNKIPIKLLTIPHLSESFYVCLYILSRSFRCN